MTTTPTRNLLAVALTPLAKIRLVHIFILATAAALVAFPLIAHPFFTLQIGAQTFVFGVVALSLTFLAAYGGMVSLAQIALYGLSAYTVAILTLRLAAPWPLVVFAALFVASAFGAIFGLIAVRTRGIYLLMITLALAILTYFFVRQNDTIFAGHIGYHGVQAPVVAGVWLREPLPFYYLTLAVATVVLFSIYYIARAPFGLALQGLRDNPRRMSALGYSVGLHKVVAFAMGGLIAGVGGVIGVWYQGGISPGSIDVARNVMILVMAVIGGIAYPIGAFVGALMFILLDNFATTYLDRVRFNTYIGVTFVLVLLLAPGGLVGVATQIRGAALQSASTSLRMAGRRRVDQESPSTPYSPPSEEPFNLLERERTQLKTATEKEAHNETEH